MQQLVQLQRRQPTGMAIALPCASNQNYLHLSLSCNADWKQSSCDLEQGRGRGAESKPARPRATHGSAVKRSTQVWAVVA